MRIKELSEEELRQIHRELHEELDRLTACYIATTHKSLEETSVMELIEWSFQQTLKPSCLKNKKL